MSEKLVTGEVINQRRAAELAVIAAAIKLLDLERNATSYGLGEPSLGRNCGDSDLRALLHGAKVLSELSAQEVFDPLNDQTN